ncbi:class I SAM-dependent methyltransferase [uncultured Psychrosphaera sp.]|uniref:class I SAM-dependent methyltransferase n=1 Tax=uncultured Psychrosphaera sp. TaxID=1403522 RepID=UPI0030F676F6
MANTKYQIPINYDLITAWDSIWHVPIEQQQKVLTKLISSLNPNGVFIFSCGGTEQKGEDTDTSMGKEVYYSTLGVNGFLQLFIDLDCICRHFEYDHPPELHRFFIFQKK